MITIYLYGWIPAFAGMTLLEGMVRLEGITSLGGMTLLKNIEYIDSNNKQTKSFVWEKTVKVILNTAKRARVMHHNIILI